MQNTPFHAYYTARKLSGYTSDESLIAAFSSSDIEVYPYQIAAAQFALRSPYLRGCVLCDESSLGKTYEVLLIATQKWYEGHTRLLLVLPVNMIGQWVKKLENDFTLPYILMDTVEAFNTAGDNPFEQDGLVITTYEFAVNMSEHIRQIKWDAVIFDEADRLNKTYTGENKTAVALKAATDGSFKILLTPTPIEMSIMDIYGLIYFIDETILTATPDEFYKYYFRRPDRYLELSEWVSKFCFRTLKSQVSGYVNFTERVPYTVGSEFTKEEKQLYNKLQEYIARPTKIAYPQIDPRDMSLQHNHILSSSAQAYAETIDGAINDLMNMPAEKNKIELYHEEIETLKDIKLLAEAVKINGKTEMLLNILKQCFSRLKKIKASQKAIVFADNLTTIKHLLSIFSEQGYAVLTFSGSNSREYSVIERFRNDKDVQILIATGGVTKGLDIEFCPLVFNYDLLSNALELEQRISRCHRQGQKADVLVINLFSKYNDADLRYLELINKRTLQFDGIFGLSDMVLGNFDLDIELDEVLFKLRAGREIQESFVQNLSAHEPENREIVKDSLNALFTTFTKEVAEKITVTPQYITEKATEIQHDLWKVVSWFFDEYNRQNSDCFFDIDEQGKTITARDYTTLPQLFYYFTGSRNKPYTSLRNYGMDKNYKPHSGRITLASPIGKGVIESLQCADDGTLMVDATVSACEIGFYCVMVSAGNTQLDEHYIFVGKTDSGNLISDEDCKKIMGLPIVSFTESEHKSAAWLKGTAHRYNELDRLLPQTELIQRSIEKANPAITEEIEQMKRRVIRQKAGLEHNLADMKTQVETIRCELENADGKQKTEQAKIQRRLKLAQAELRKRENSLYAECSQLDSELERQIAEFGDKHRFTAKVTRHFTLKVTGI